MVREYAVDPEAAVTCDSPVKFLDEFGRDTGRLIAPLPKANKWFSAAGQALRTGIEQGRIPRTLKGAKRLEEKLTELALSKPAKDALFAPVPRAYDGTRSWLENGLAPKVGRFRVETRLRSRVQQQMSFLVQGKV